MLAADLSRDELEALLPYRLSDAAILAAKAQVARRKADRLREEWRRQSSFVATAAHAAKKIGERTHYRGTDFAAAMADANGRRGFARDAEKIYLRAEREAQALERALRRETARVEKAREASCRSS